MRRHNSVEGSVQNTNTQVYWLAICLNAILTSFSLSFSLIFPFKPSLSIPFPPLMLPLNTLYEIYSSKMIFPTLPSQCHTSIQRLLTLSIQNATQRGSLITPLHGYHPGPWDWGFPGTALGEGGAGPVQLGFPYQLCSSVFVVMSL